MATIPPTPSLPVNHDLHCVHCQYNLRTLLPDARCPECGNPVADSLTHHQTHAGALAQAGSLRAAAFCFAILCLLALPVHLGFLALGHTQILPWQRSVVEIATHLVFVLTLAAGILLFNGGLGKTVINAAIRSLLSMVAVAYAANALLSSMGMITNMFFARRWRGGPAGMGGGRAPRIPELLLREQRIMTALVIAILAVIAYFVMRQVAKSLASPQLERTSRLTFAALALGALFSLATCIAMGAFRRVPDPAQFNSLFTALDACNAVIAAFVGGYWLYVARLIRGRAAHIRQSPQAARNEPAPPPLPAQDKVAQFLARRGPEAAP